MHYVHCRLVFSDLASADLEDDLDPHKKRMYIYIYLILPLTLVDATTV